MNLVKINNKAELFTRVNAGNFIVRKRGDVVLGFYKIKSKDPRHLVTDSRTFTYKELFNFAKVYLVTGEIAPVEAEDSDAPKSATDRDAKFILWSPKSNLPPRVILDDGLEAAMGVAETMAKRHHGKFYVAHLVGVAEEKVKQRIVRDVTFESKML